MNAISWMWLMSANRLRHWTKSRLFVIPLYTFQTCQFYLITWYLINWALRWIWGISFSSNIVSSRAESSLLSLSRVTERITLLSPYYSLTPTFFSFPASNTLSFRTCCLTYINNHYELSLTKTHCTIWIYKHYWWHPLLMLDIWLVVKKYVWSLVMELSQTQPKERADNLNRYIGQV